MVLINNLNKIGNRKQDDYLKLKNNFISEFKSEPDFFLSVPGRAEILGNHTDYNNGLVLACAVDRDILTAVKKNDRGLISFYSHGFKPGYLNINNYSFDKSRKPCVTNFLIGVLEVFKELGYNIGGFDAYSTSNILKGAGLSSSAAFETTICEILNYLYNDNKIDPLTIAKISKKVENDYYFKPCGLMDQLTINYGGLVYMDFNKEKYENIEFDISKYNYSIVITDCGANHENNTSDYKEIKDDMKSVAKYFDKEYLIDVEKELFLNCLPKLKTKVSSRAILRALHFFDENERVKNAYMAIKDNDFDKFLLNVKLSGQSSYKYLQNIYSTKSPDNQNLALALYVADKFLKDDGVTRVHGGGFGGTIISFVKQNKKDMFISHMQNIFGEKACFEINIRNISPARVNILI